MKRARVSVRVLQTWARFLVACPECKVEALEECKQLSMDGTWEGWEDRPKSHKSRLHAWHKAGQPHWDSLTELEQKMIESILE